MANKEISFEKTYDAPIDSVWQAWTDPEMLKQWWGPNNVTIPQCEVDLRVGGKFYIVMEAAEGMGEYKGTRWPMSGEFTAVEPNSRLAYNAKAWTEGADEETQIDSTTEVTLREDNGKTKLKLRAVVNNVGPGALMAIQGMQSGFTEQLDKLRNFLTGK